jgi:hypothetical protein
MREIEGKKVNRVSAACESYFDGGFLGIELDLVSPCQPS